MKIGGRIPPALWLAAMGVIGLALIVVPDYTAQWHESDFGITHDIGIAILSASILGFTIDRWLKAEIVTDVFEAAMGHVLPKEYLHEIQRILTNKFICEKHQMIVEISDRGNDTVKITNSVERTSRNISAFPESIPALVHLDEWGFDEQSTILDCEITAQGRQPEKFNCVIRNPDMSITAETAKVQVNPGETATVKLKWSEIRRANDEVSWIFLAPTLRPEIEVRLPMTFDYRCRFGTPSEKQDSSTIVNRHQLIGTYFPGQRMKVRWWPKPVSSTASRQKSK